MYKKLFKVFVCVFALALMATSAMAFQVTNRSAEMTANSLCDRAGTIKMALEEKDWDAIAAYLAAHPGGFAEIRIALNGTDLPPNPHLPLLCRAISGSAVKLGVPNSGQLVRLATNTVDISQFDPTQLGGMEIYVFGGLSQQVIHVFITTLGAKPLAQAFINGDVWFKIGLDPLDGTTPALTYSHAICADVRDFSGISKLTISNEVTPTGLTFTGDNEIGHFVVQPITLRKCGKGDLFACAVGATSTDPNGVTALRADKLFLCSMGTAQATTCPTGQECFALTADNGWPLGDILKVVLRTNGSKDGSTDQLGIYFTNVVLKGTDNTVIGPAPGFGPVQFFDAAGNLLGGAPRPACEFKAVRAEMFVSTADINIHGKDLGFCVNYGVDVTKALANTFVRFWIDANALPCGNIISAGLDTSITQILPCTPVARSNCIYFEYVLINQAPWQTGIAISNVGSATAVPLASLNATFTLVDSDGKVFTWNKTGFEGNTIAFFLDSKLSNFTGTGTPKAGPGWLKVQTTNFLADGFEFLTNNGQVGASVNARWCGENNVLNALGSAVGP